MKKRKNNIRFSKFLLLEQNPTENQVGNETNNNLGGNTNNATGGTENNNQENANQGADALNIFNDENINDVSENLQEIDAKSNVDLSGDSDISSENQKSDEEKVKELFTDTGDPKIDYSINTDANKRLAKFKFTYAGINLDTILTKKEKEIGIRVNEILDRLTPEQYQIYLQKSKELRKEFPKIAEREKRIIIYNSNVQFFINDKNGIPKQITHKNDLANAIKKLETFMNKKFGEDWVDNKDAINFLKNIKVNFSEENKILPNLLPVSFLYQEVKENEFSLFNKIYVDFPQSVKTFIENNLKNDLYIKSPLFRSFVNDYNETKDSSKMSIFAIIKLEKSEDSEAEETGSKGEEEGAGEETGGGEAGGGLGGGLGGELGGETGEGLGGETGGEAGGELGGEELPM